MALSCRNDICSADGVTCVGHYVGSASSATSSSSATSHGRNVQHLQVCWEDGPDGKPVVTGLRMRKAGKEWMVHADCYVGALDCQGAKRLLPQAWRKFPLFDNIHKLEGVPVITVQLRCGLLAARCADCDAPHSSFILQVLSRYPHAKRVAAVHAKLVCCAAPPCSHRAPHATAIR
jgi:hypothetical protein